MREAADQTVALARLTPHRVMRELYEQAIAYWRAYADAIPTYESVDDHLAGVAVSTSSTILRSWRRGPSEFFRKLLGSAFGSIRLDRPSNYGGGRMGLRDSVGRA